MEYVLTSMIRLTFALNPDEYFRLVLCYITNLIVFSHIVEYSSLNKKLQDLPSQQASENKKSWLI